MITTDLIFMNSRTETQCNIGDFPLIINACSWITNSFLVFYFRVPNNRLIPRYDNFLKFPTFLQFFSNPSPFLIIL